MLTLLERFQTNPQSRRQAQELFSSELGHSIKAILNEQHPARYDFAGWSTEERASWQARTAGFEKALNVLDALCEMPTQAKKVPSSTYGAKDEDIKPTKKE